MPYISHCRRTIVYLQIKIYFKTAGGAASQLRYAHALHHVLGCSVANRRAALSGHADRLAASLVPQLSVLAIQSSQTVVSSFQSLHIDERLRCSGTTRGFDDATFFSTVVL